MPEAVEYYRNLHRDVQVHLHTDTWDRVFFRLRCSPGFFSLGLRVPCWFQTSILGRPWAPRISWTGCALPEFLHSFVRSMTNVKKLRVPVQERVAIDSRDSA